MLSLWKSVDYFRKLCFPSTVLRLLGFILHVGWPLYHTSPLRCCGITGVCYHVQSFHMDSGDQTQTAKVCRANVSKKKKNHKPPKPCNIPFHTLKSSSFWEHVSNLWVACPHRLTGHLETPTSSYLIIWFLRALIRLPYSSAFSDMSAEDSLSVLFFPILCSNN